MSLRGLSEEQRAGFMRWGTTTDPTVCSVATNPKQVGHRDVCGKPAEWKVDVEDAEAGVDQGFGFEPAMSSGRMCREHAEQLRLEPRIVFHARRLPRGDQ